MANTDSLFNSLEKAQDFIFKTIDILDALSKDALQFNGELARVIPLNIKKDIEILDALVNGSDQSSLNQLMEYLNSVPLKDTRSQSIVSRGKPTINTDQGGDSGDVMTSDAGINTTPDLSTGPKSAVLADSILDKYLKQDSRSKRISESNSLKEKQHKLSLELTFDDDAIGQDMDAEYSMDNNAGEYSFDEVSDDDEYSDEFYGEDSVEDWKSVSKANNPSEPKTLDFNDILENDDLISEDDDDTDLIGALNKQNLPPVDPMKRMVKRPSSAPIDNTTIESFEGDDTYGVGDDFGPDPQPDFDDDDDGEGYDNGQSFEDEGTEESVGTSDWKSLIDSSDGLDFDLVSGNKSPF